MIRNRDYRVEKSRRDYLSRSKDLIFEAWSTNLILLIGIILGLSNYYLLITMIGILFWHICEAFYWSKFYILKLELQQGVLYFEYLKFNKSNSVSGQISDFTVKLSPLPYKNRMYSVKIYNKGNHVVTQFPSKNWRTEELESINRIINEKKQ
jgi:hypothetical protein